MPKSKNQIQLLGYTVKNGYICFPDKYGRHYAAFSEIYVIERIRNINREEYYLKLELVVWGQSKTLVIERKKILKRSIIEILMSKGVTIHEDLWDKLQQYLLDSEQQAPIKLVHDDIGLHEIDGTKVFLLNEAINYPVKSDYDGRLNLQKKGTLAKAIVNVNQLLSNHVEMQFALVLGLASPLLSILKQHYNLVNPIFHFDGESTSGKTTMARLAVSSFGSMAEDGGGLITTYSSTPNAMTGFLVGNHGVPIAFDESTLKARSNKTNLIYQMASGREKMRLGSDMNIREIGEWSGIMISTGESSILDESDALGGLRVRVFEFNNVQWTPSAEVADELTYEFGKVIGCLGESFVKELLAIDEDVLCDLYEQAKKVTYDALILTDEFSKRISYILAVIYLAAKLANEFWSVNLDVDGILDFMVTNDQKKLASRNRPIEAYEYFKQMVLKNSNKFYHVGKLKHYGSEKYDKEYEGPANQIWGKITSNNRSINQVMIINEVLDDLLVDGGFLSPNVIKRKWRKDKVILCDTDKFTKNLKIAPKMPNTRCVVFDFDNKYESETELEKKTKKKKLRESGIFSENDE